MHILPEEATISTMVDEIIKWAIEQGHGARVTVKGKRIKAKGRTRETE